MTTPTPPDDADAPVEHDLMLLPEVCDYFRVKEYTATLWLRDPEKRAFPNAFKLGGTWRVPRSDVVDFARRLSQGFVLGDLKPRK